MQPILASLLAFAAPAAAQEAPPPKEPEIVVTGVRLSDTKHALDACLARRCPPKEDIAATLAHTENLFVAGQYENAQNVAAAGIRRNRGHAKELPREVAGLFRAHSRLSANLGEVQQERSSATDMVQALRAGLGDTQADVLVGRIELADVYAKQGAFEIAEANYRDIARAAQAAGYKKVEGYARFRHGMVLSSLARADYPYTVRARAVLRDLAASTAPELAVFADAARTGLKRLELRNAKPEQLAQMLASLQGGTPTARPTLLYGEGVDLNNARTGRDSGSVTTLASADRVEDQWVDVAFYIDAKGLPQDIEVVRTSDAFSGGWDEAVLKSIRTRRYAPLTLVDGQPGVFRVERYTKTAPLVEISGSRFLQRSAVSRVEMTDLSVEPSASAGAAAPKPTSPTV
ncbi:hypothetical protein [Sphingomonas sp. VNH70]|uniref:energy transducer TonB n=1 Tax=Sphingomonas silueang TaxID=3156617 RepID=UPI0032B46F55